MKNMKQKGFVMIKVNFSFKSYSSKSYILPKTQYSVSKK
ncbi:hypothetical protein pb186bvf_020826, partial [Paramecium bursaria]